MYHWNRLPDPTRFAEVQGLCADPHGNVLGDRYPTDPFDADYYTMRQVLQLRGDRKGMIRADVLRAYPFPEEFVGVLVPEAIVLNRIAKSFLIRGFNEVLAQNEYLPDGMTRHRSRLHRENSGPRLLYFEELLDMAQSRPLPPRARWKAYANLTRNGLHQGRPLRIQAARAPSRGWWLGSLPFGALLFVRDLLTGRV
jgi:hypothetical protein